MARALRIEYSGAFYHITCRGNEQKSIFKDEEDRLAFLDRLKVSLENYGVILHVYVLMNNHFHLVVETPQVNLSEFMRHFNVSYTGYFNRRHRRVGHLYQGRFKAILVEVESYLLELSRYVHLNPVRVKEFRKKPFSDVKRFILGYKWSSLKGYLRRRERQRYVEYRTVLGYTGGDSEKGRQRYGRFIEEGLRKGVNSPWENVRGQILLCSEGFVENMHKYIERGKVVSREQPAVRAMAKRWEAKDIIDRVSRVLGRKSEELCRRGGGIERAIVMECLHRYGQMSQGEIGAKMGGVDYSWVSRMRIGLRRLMEEDKEVKILFQRIESTL